MSKTNSTRSPCLSRSATVSNTGPSTLVANCLPQTRWRCVI
nr:MAG TPA: hypothetical protein [Caudoviricetes sp.]